MSNHRGSSLNSIPCKELIRVVKLLVVYFWIKYKTVTISVIENVNSLAWFTVGIYILTVDQTRTIFKKLILLSLKSLFPVNLLYFLCSKRRFSIFLTKNCITFSFLIISLLQDFEYDFVFCQIIPQHFLTVDRGKTLRYTE